MPYDANRIMKLDPNNNDAISSVGHETLEWDSTLEERLSALTNVCMEFLVDPTAS